MSKKQLTLGAPAKTALTQLGQDIQRARLRRQLTQTELASRCDLDPQTISRLEHGEAGVSIGVIALVLSDFDLLNPLENLLARDPIGEALERVGGRKRARLRMLDVSKLDF